MHIIRSIYWDQSNSDELVYKFPFNNITMGSVLTVNASQVACFFKNGTLCDVFEGGRYTLSTSNLPILHKLIELPSGGETTFKAEVWFVNMLEKRNILWGGGGLRIMDPFYQIPIKLSARGQYGLKINDPAIFLRKFVGTLKQSSINFVNEQFRADVIESVKITIASFLKSSGENIRSIGQIAGCDTLQSLVNTGDSDESKFSTAKLSFKSPL